MTPQEFNIALARLNMGRRELADDTGLSVSYLSRCKTGKAKVSRLLQGYLELRIWVSEEYERRWQRINEATSSPATGSGQVME